MLLELFLGKVHHLLCKPFAARGINGSVSRGHGSGVADDGIEWSVAGKLGADFGRKGIAHIGSDRRRDGVEVQRIEVHADDGSLALEQHAVRVEGPASWGCADIQHGIARLDDAICLLDFLELVDAAGGIALAVGSLGVGICCVSSAGCHAAIVS